jgi:polysaccharide deacetylase family protein (PEP-CTERM system associated)
LPLLAEAGFKYDCSIFPIRHDLYGLPGGPRRPFRLETPAGPLVELPVSTVRVAGLVLPATGGGYLRILPMWYTRAAVARLRREGLALILYVHPWEIDPEQPRIQARLCARLRHYTHLSLTLGRLTWLLVDTRFDSISGAGTCGECAAAPPGALERIGFPA